MKFIDERVASIMNEKHAKDVEGITNNGSNSHFSAWGIRYGTGDQKKSGHKLDSRWLGSAVVTGREGEHSYVIQVKPEVSMKAHRNFLKPHRGGESFWQGIATFLSQKDGCGPRGLIRRVDRRQNFVASSEPTREIRILDQVEGHR